MYSGISRETLYQTFNLYDMDLQCKIVNMNLFSGHGLRKTERKGKNTGTISRLVTIV